MQTNTGTERLEAEPGRPDQLQEFEARLDARTKVPSERLPEFLNWSDKKVRREARQVTQILKRFAEAVVQSLENGNRLNDFLTALDLKTVSRDHDWRTIFATLRGRCEARDEPYKRAMFIKYLQYLSFRKRLLNHIHARKAGLQETDELSLELRGAAPADDREDAAADSVERRSDSKGFARMPLAETIELVLEDGDMLELALARQRFELVAGARPHLVDRNGVTCFLKPGRSLVGRHPESDVTVDANFGDVSRAHLVLEWDGAQRYRLMDLSSRGTWLERHVLEEARSVASAQELVQEHIAFAPRAS